MVIRSRLTALMPADSPDFDPIFEALVTASGGSFAYVTQIFIEYLAPEAEKNGGHLPLSAVAPDQLPQSIDGLYLSVFGGRIKATYGTRDLLQVLVVARENLTLPDLALLAGMDPGSDKFKSCVQALQPYFEVVTVQGVDRIRPFHKSVVDYLTDLTRAGRDLYMDVKVCFHCS